MIRPSSSNRFNAARLDSNALIIDVSCVTLDAGVITGLELVAGLGLGAERPGLEPGTGSSLGAGRDPGDGAGRGAGLEDCDRLAFCREEVKLKSRLLIDSNI